MKRLSGDENGHVAPSVPGIDRAATASSGRSQSSFLPDGSLATNVIRRPSGDMVSDPESSPPISKAVFSGGRIEERIGAVSTGARRTYPNVANPAARIAPAATLQAMRSRLRRRETTTAGAPACEPPSTIHWSWSFASCAVWKRSSGSFARHVRTTRSNAGGVIGWIVETGTGSSFMMFEINDARLVPEKAFRPVAIS